MHEVHHGQLSYAHTSTYGNKTPSIQHLRISIDDWYTSGCLTCPVEEDNVPVHNSVTWLSARYYFLLILLYYPCETNVQNRVVVPVELAGYVQRHLKSQLALVQQRQLPLNRVTLARLLPVGISITYCARILHGSEVIQECVIELIALFNSFSERWTLARQGAAIMQDWHNTFTVRESSSSPGGQSEGYHRNESTVGEIEVALARLVELTRVELSKSTCFAAVSC